MCSVPKTIRKVQDVLSQLVSEQFIKTDLDGYRISSVASEYGGVKQRWIVVESEQKKALDQIGRASCRERVSSPV